MERFQKVKDSNGQVIPLNSLFGFACQAVLYADGSYGIQATVSGKWLEYSTSPQSFPYRYGQMSEWLYGGPLNYYACRNGQVYAAETGELLLVNQQAVQQQLRRLPTVSEPGGARGKECWIGINERAFFLYRQWKTPAGYLCGTYAAAVMLAYYQDYKDPAIIPSHIRSPFETDGRQLVQRLKHFIQPWGFPTTPLRVGVGISRYFDMYHLPYRGRTTSFGSWQRATKRINQGKPLMVGIVKWLGSSYGNHWVVAYSYLETKNGDRYYKIHDNWGSYNKVIAASWGNGTVSLP